MSLILFESQAGQSFLCQNKLVTGEQTDEYAVSRKKIFPPLAEGSSNGEEKECMQCSSGWVMLSGQTAMLHVLITAAIS